MTNPFHVDLEHVEDLVAQLDGLSGFIRDCLDELDRRVQELQGDWQGLAAQAHADAHREWTTGAKEFNIGIGEMRDALKAAHGHYSMSMDVNKRMLRQ